MESRFFLTVGDNPFLNETEVENSRLAVHQAIAEIFFDKWAVEKRTFEYWYDQERNAQQRNYAQAAVRAIRDRGDAVVAIVSGAKPGLDLLNKMMLSPYENLLQTVIDIFARAKDGGFGPKKKPAN